MFKSYYLYLFFQSLIKEYVPLQPNYLICEVSTFDVGISHGFFFFLFYRIMMYFESIHLHMENAFKLYELEETIRDAHKLSLALSLPLLRDALLLIMS